MDKIEYRKYLKSSHWKNVKSRYAQSKLHSCGCYVCGSRSNIHHHHKTYKNLGSERMMDLVYLCKDCHGFTHDLIKSGIVKKVTLWNASKRLRKVFAKRGKAGMVQWLYEKGVY